MSMGKNKGAAKRRRKLEKLQSCTDQLKSFKRFCDNHGFDLRVCNNGRHWIITTATWRAEWWPTSGKLVFNSKWDRPREAHTVDDLKTRIMIYATVQEMSQNGRREKQLDHGLDSALERDQ